MRNRFAEVFYEIAKNDPSLNLIVADISPAGSIEKFRKEFPERFINTGVAEQIMIGLAAGMSQRGLRPFAYTIATFALYRPYEFIRNDLCYQNLPVTIVGIGGGRTYSTLGATHHAQEDISLASSLPNMNIIAPCDPSEVESAVRWCAQDRENGPVYLRLGKAGEPDLTLEAQETWSFGKIRRITLGREVAILSYGTISKLAQEVHAKLKEGGNLTSLYFVSTVKPLDFPRIDEIFKTHSVVVIIEEHISSGSLGEKIRSHAQEASWTGKIFAFCLSDNFSHLYGSHQDLLRNSRLTAEDIISNIS